MRIRELIIEEKPGHKALAKGLNATSNQVKKYLKKLDSSGEMSKLKKKSSKAIDPDAYKWGTIRKILKRKFGEDD